MTARRVCVTGATGKAGRATVRELRAHGYDAVATDTVHLANIPAPGRATPAVTFNANVTMNFNVFHAAAAHPAPLSLGDGGVWSTARDLLRRGQALDADELGISALMETPPG